jgi:hypothetical protein
MGFLTGVELLALDKALNAKFWLRTSDGCV